ncbi:VENN motif pre-toxin domain-containing protein, partial [Moraxella catarrhalis]|uniref:VENN motif pre-toxin domain-containing protein n=1 Tax=Moraxella catarrhalis TaxID=480 RepID=UPI00217ED9C8
KDKLINQAKLIAGITAAFAGEDVNVAAGVAAEAVENNAFAEIYPNEWDEIVNNTDGSYGLELHEAISRNKQYILIGTSFIPVVGDIQGFVEAQTAGDYVFATIGLIPGLGDVAQKAHKAKKAYDTAKSANDVKGMKSAIQEGVDVLKQNQGKAGTPVVSQPVSGVQAQRQIRSGQANIAGYTIDKNGRLHNNRGQFTSDPNNPRVSTNLIRPNLRAKLRRQVDANYIRLPNGNYQHKDTREIVISPTQYGHTYGREHRRLVLAAEQTGL